MEDEQDDSPNRSGSLTPVLRSEATLPFYRYKDVHSALCKLKEALQERDTLLDERQRDTLPNLDTLPKVLLDYLAPDLLSPLVQYNRPLEKLSWYLMMANFLVAR